MRDDIDVPPTIEGLTRARNLLVKRFEKERQRLGDCKKSLETCKADLATALAVIEDLNDVFLVMEEALAYYALERAYEESELTGLPSVLLDGGALAREAIGGKQSD